MPTPLIQCENVRFRHPNRADSQGEALKGINLKIEDGEYVAIVGANGSGKSTLARHLNALYVPTEGRVLIQGMDTRDPQYLQEIRSLVGMVFQSPEDQLVATVVEEDVAFGPENLGLPTAEIQQRVQRSLEVAGMVEHRKRPPHMLSEGQKQRVALAGVLAMSPKCVVFDETTAMLDPGGRAMVRRIIRDLNNRGLAVIVITHFMAEAVEADRVIVLEKGNLMFDGTPKQLFIQNSDLASYNLDLPHAARIARRLEPIWPSFPRNLLSPEELFNALPRCEVCGPLTNKKFAGNGSRELSGMLAIDARNVSHVYLKDTPLAHLALTDASVQVRDGTSHGLIGSTGSGKSTLLQHLNGLFAPQTGTVRIGPYQVDAPDVDLKAVRCYAGLVFQNPDFQMFEQYVGDEIAYAPKQQGVTAGLREIVANAMNRVGLNFQEYKDRYTFGLSGGEKRKVALASILAMDPQILLLDEPTAGLDPVSRRELLGYLKHVRDEGKSLVVSSHHMEDIAELTDDVTALQHGTSKLSGRTADVFDQITQVEDMGLEPPMVSVVASVLRSKGWPLTHSILRGDDLVQELERLKGIQHESV